MNSLASDLNNRGALSLVHGNTEQAFKCFEKALDVIDEYSPLCVLSQPINPSPALPSAEIHQAQQTTLPCTALAIPPPSERTANYRNSSESDYAFVFTKPFVFTASMTTISPSIQQEAHKAVVVYNLGLVYHHYRWSNCHLLKAATDTALSLYDQCLHLLTVVVQAQPQASQLFFYNLVVATLNNKAQIHHSRHEIVTTRTVLNQLGTILSSAVQNDPLSFEERDIDGLVLNVSCLLPISSASAA